jgi:hypothetical protein
MIRTLEDAGVDHVLIWDMTLGSEALRFRNSHPRVWAYLDERFERVQDRRLAPAILLLQRGAP